MIDAVDGQRFSANPCKQRLLVVNDHRKHAPWTELRNELLNRKPWIAQMIQHMHAYGKSEGMIRKTTHRIEVIFYFKLAMRIFGQGCMH